MPVVSAALILSEVESRLDLKTRKTQKGELQCREKIWRFSQAVHGILRCAVKDRRSSKPSVLLKLALLCHVCPWFLLYSSFLWHRCFVGSRVETI